MSLNPIITETQGSADPCSDDPVYADEPILIVSLPDSETVLPTVNAPSGEEGLERSSPKGNGLNVSECEQVLEHQPDLQHINNAGVSVLDQPRGLIIALPHPVGLPPGKFQHHHDFQNDAEFPRLELPCGSVIDRPQKVRQAGEVQPSSMSPTSQRCNPRLTGRTFSVPVHGKYKYLCDLQAPTINEDELEVIGKELEEDWQVQNSKKKKMAKAKQDKQEAPKRRHSKDIRQQLNLSPRWTRSRGGEFYD